MQPYTMAVMTCLISTGATNRHAIRARRAGSESEQGQNQGDRCVRRTDGPNEAAKLCELRNRDTRR